MALIEWQKQFATGIESIDAQHRQLITLINRLAVAIEQHERDEVVDILDDIQGYVADHFTYEEQLFAQAGFKFSESHIRGHRRFAERFNSLQQRFESGGYVTRELHNFLQRWLTSHIALEDKQYVTDVKRIIDHQRCEA